MAGTSAATEVTPSDAITEPASGWPWQLKNCTVLKVEKKGGKLNYKFECNICGKGSNGLTTLTRVAQHYSRTTKNIVHCVEHSVLERDHPELWGHVKKVIDRAGAGIKESLVQPQRANSSADGSVLASEADAHSQQTSIWWAAKSLEEKAKAVQEAHEAWDMFFFVHNLAFHLIETQEFLLAIEKTKKAPPFKPCSRLTLSTSHLEARNAEANEWKATVLEASAKYGFVLTGDGFTNKRKRHYNNYILTTINGPVYLMLVDKTGEAADANAIADEFKLVIEALPEDVQNGIIAGILDTPSANRKAWGILMKEFPTHYWQGCMAHEASLLMKDVCKLPESKRLHKLCKGLVKWVMNHNVGEAAVRAIFGEAVQAHFDEKMKAYVGPDARKVAL